jgi:omega-hydroxy-beta-dihydromenaquinone-9 sulfotransferase
MISGYLITGIKLRLLIRMMRRNKASLYPKYFFRFLFLFQNALWASLFSIIDKRRWGKQIGAHPLPDDPVFIIGHWRTGSTFLHQLLNLDKQLAAPTLFQTSLPESYLSARPYYAPIMKRLVWKKRPFDQMKTGIDEPQEDEFALLRLTAESPLVQLMFPVSDRYFLLQDRCRFLYQGNGWEQALDYFYRKISWHSGKRLVLKNPFHSMRIELLRSHFPGARFIHIYRNPLDTIPSTQNMWTIVGSQNAMNRNWHPPAIKEITDFYILMLDEIQKQLSVMPRGISTEVRYEDLERDPVNEIKRIYRDIGIEFSRDFEKQLTGYLKANSNYEKNSYTLDDQNKEYICNKMNRSMKHYGYLD